MQRFRNNPRQQKTLWNPKGLQVIREITTDFSDIASTSFPQKTYAIKLGEHFEANISFESAPENPAFWGNTQAFDVSTETADSDGGNLSVFYLGVVASKPSSETANDLDSSSVVLSYALAKTLERNFKQVMGAFNLILLKVAIRKSFDELYGFLVNTDAATKYGRDVRSMLSELQIAVLKITASTAISNDVHKASIEVLTAGLESKEPALFDFSWGGLPDSSNSAVSQPQWRRDVEIFENTGSLKNLQIDTLNLPDLNSVKGDVGMFCNLSISQRILDQSGVQKTPFKLSFKMYPMEVSEDISKKVSQISTTIPPSSSTIEAELLPPNVIKDLDKYVKPFIMSKKDAAGSSEIKTGAYLCIYPDGNFFFAGHAHNLAFYTINPDLKMRLLAAGLPRGGFAIEKTDISKLAKTPLDLNAFPQQTPEISNEIKRISESITTSKLLEKNSFGISVSIPESLSTSFVSIYGTTKSIVFLLDHILLSFSFYKNGNNVQCKVMLKLNTDVSGSLINESLMIAWKDSLENIAGFSEGEAREEGFRVVLSESLPVNLLNTEVKAAFAALPSNTQEVVFDQTMEASLFRELLDNLPKPKQNATLGNMLFLCKTEIPNKPIVFTLDTIPNFKVFLSSEEFMSDTFRGQSPPLLSEDLSKTSSTLQDSKIQKEQTPTAVGTTLQFPPVDSNYAIDRFNFGKFLLDYVVSGMSGKDSLYLNAKKKFIVMSSEDNKHMTFVHFPKKFSVNVTDDNDGSYANFVMIDKDILVAMKDSPDADLDLDPRRQQFSLLENTLGGLVKGKDSTFCEGKDIRLPCIVFDSYFEDERLSRRISSNWDYTFSINLSRDLKSKLRSVFVNIFPDFTHTKYASFLSGCDLGVKIFENKAYFKLLVMTTTEDEFPTKLRSGAKAMHLHVGNLKKALEEKHAIAFDILKSSTNPAEDFLCIAKDSTTGDIIQITYRYGVSKRGSDEDNTAETSLIKAAKTYIDVLNKGLHIDADLNHPSFTAFWDKLKGLGSLSITQAALKKYLKPTETSIVEADVIDPTKTPFATIALEITIPVNILKSVGENTTEYSYEYQIPYKIVRPYVDEAMFASDVIGRSEIYFSTKIPQKNTDILVVSNGGLMLKWANVYVKKVPTATLEEKALVQKPFSVKDLTFNLNECVLPKPSSSGKGFYELWVGETEVTQDLFKAVMGWNDSFNKGFGENPVEGVTWYDCLLFCNKLSELYGLTPCYTLTNIERKAIKITQKNGLLVQLDAFNNQPLVSKDQGISDGVFEDEGFDDEDFEEEDVEGPSSSESKKSSWEKLYSGKQYNTKVSKIEYADDFDISPFKSHSPHVSHADVVWNKNANGFRLPTAYEWFVCAKAGTEYEYGVTNVESFMGGYSWHKENSDGETHPVAQLKPNKWGLYDMSGNVGEWCWSFVDKEPVSLGGSYGTPPLKIEYNKIESFPESLGAVFKGPFLFPDIGFRICQGPFPATASAFSSDKIPENKIIEVEQEIYQQDQVIFKLNQCVIPQTEVNSPYELLMGETEVTESLFAIVMGTQGVDTSEKPIVDVSWYKALEFCNKLSVLEGLRPCYHIKPISRTKDGDISSANVTWDQSADGFRLPTFFEWRTCAEAGTNNTWSGVDVEAYLVEYCWHDRNSEGRIHPVGKLKPNEWGLYDMSGNVGEWCWDQRYGEPKVLGGNFKDPPERCTYASQTSKQSNDFSFWIGFRVCRGIVPTNTLDVAQSDTNVTTSQRTLDMVSPQKEDLVETVAAPLTAETQQQVLKSTEAAKSFPLSGLPSSKSEKFGINAMNFGEFVLNYVDLMRLNITDPYSSESDRLFFHIQDRVAITQKATSSYNLAISLPNNLDIEVRNDSKNALGELVLVNREILEAMKAYGTDPKELVVDVSVGKLFLKDPDGIKKGLSSYLMGAEDMARIVSSFTSTYKGTNYTKLLDPNNYSFYVAFSYEILGRLLKLEGVFVALSEKKFEAFFANCAIEVSCKDDKGAFSLLVSDKAASEFPTKLPSSGNPVRSYPLSKDKLGYILSLKDVETYPTRHHISFDLFKSPYDEKANTLCIAKNLGTGDILQITYKNVFGAKAGGRPKEDIFLKDLFSCYTDPGSGTPEKIAVLKKFLETNAVAWTDVDRAKSDKYMLKIKEYFDARDRSPITESGDNTSSVFVRTQVLSDIGLTLIKEITDPGTTYKYILPYPFLKMYADAAYYPGKVGRTYLFFSKSIQKAANAGVDITPFLVATNVDLIRNLRAVRTTVEKDLPIEVPTKVITQTQPINVVSADGTSYTANNVKFDLIPCTIGTSEKILMGETEVTQELFQAVMGWNDSYAKREPQTPVDQVTWYDCIDFCNKLSNLLGLEECYQMSDVIMNNVHIAKAKVIWDETKNGFRLPTEKEWELCAKADTQFVYSGSNTIHDVAWYSRNSNSKTWDVSTKLPNGWGLYDMSGNVWEWCWDLYEDAPEDTSMRVVRGGSAWSSADGCEITNRFWSEDADQSYDQGFRLCRSLNSSQAKSFFPEDSSRLDGTLTKTIEALTGQSSVENEKASPEVEGLFELKTCEIPKPLGISGGTYTLSMGETEVTQALFKAVMGWNDSVFKDNPLNPVESITWFDCLAFCNKLSELYALTPCYKMSDIEKSTLGEHHIDYAKVFWDETANGFRLPTEAEWVFCAKAGTENAWSGTNNKDDLGEYAWYSKYSGNKTHPVKTLKPNAWGLFDMSGNVSEYCWSFYARDDGKIQVFTPGGCYYSHDPECRIAYRLSNSASTWMSSGGKGFRICKGNYLEKNQILPTVSVSSKTTDVQVGPKGLQKAVNQTKVQVGSAVFTLNTCGISKQKDTDMDYSLSMGTTEVTQELWQTVMGWNESHFKEDDAKNLPVETVTWFDCILFCNRLSELSGLKPCYVLWNIEKEGYHIKNAIVDLDESADGYRLPTTHEMWVCSQAGTSNKYPGTNDDGELSTYIWYSRNARGKTHPVGQKAPNEWGFYDMSGNVWEWCWDLLPNDGEKKRQIHGGSFDVPSMRLNNLHFSPEKPSEKGKDIGLRICLRNYSKGSVQPLDGNEAHTSTNSTKITSVQISPTSISFKSLPANKFLDVLTKFTSTKKSDFAYNIVLDSQTFLVLNNYFYAEAKSCDNITILEDDPLGLIPKEALAGNLNKASLMLTEANGLFKKLDFDETKWRNGREGYTSLSDTNYVLHITQDFRNAFRSLETNLNLKDRVSAKKYDNNNDTIIFRQISDGVIGVYLFQGTGITVGDGSYKYFGDLKGVEITLISSLPFTQASKPTGGFNDLQDEGLQNSLPNMLYHFVPLEYFSLVLDYSDVIRLNADLNQIFDKIQKQGQMRTSVYMQSSSGDTTFGFQGLFYRSPDYSNVYTEAFEKYDKKSSKADSTRRNPFDDHVISSSPNPKPVKPKENQTEVQRKAFQHLSYLASIASNSDRSSSSIPSTTSQILFANKFLALLSSLGLKAHKDKNYNVIISIPGLNAGVNAKPLALMAHYDTVPQTRAISKLNILENWDGKARIPYLKNQNVDINTVSYPVLKQFIGEDVIYGNGDYPYGLDDKLGLTHLLTLACWLTNNRDNPKLSYPPVYLIARPDEEIGRDAVLEPLASFLKENQVQFLYTVDGVSRFEINTVSFNAASFKMTFLKQTTKLKAPACQVTIKLQAVSAHTATAYEEGYKPAIRIASQIYAKIKDNPIFYLQDYLASHKPAPNTDTNDPSSATLKVLVTEAKGLPVLEQIVQTVVDPYKAKGASFEIQVSQARQDFSWDPALVHIFNYLQDYLNKPSKFQELAENTADWEGFCDPTQIFDDGSQWGLVFRVRAFETAEMEARKLFLFTEAKKLGAQAAYRDQHSNSSDNDVLPRLAHEIPLACGEDLKLPVTLSPFRGGIGADALQIAGIHVCNLGTGYFAAENFRELTSLQMLYAHPLWYFYICQHFAIKDVREHSIAKANLKKLQPTMRFAHVQKHSKPDVVYDLGSKEHHVFGEAPLNLVYCPGDLWVSSTQITQNLWQTITGQNPSKYKDPRKPVENVSFLDCVDFCNRLSVNEGLKPCYSISSSRIVTFNPDNSGYRLLTDEEWKVCANLNRFYFAGSDELEQVGWYCGNSGKVRLSDTIWNKTDEEIEEILIANGCQTHPVGELMPNELGLYDMSGNVWEWVIPTSMTQFSSTSSCLIIGGSFTNSSADCTADSVIEIPIKTRESNLGLRVCKKSILD